MMTMLVFIFPAMVLSVRILQVGAIVAPTFKVRDPQTGTLLECKSCPPGNYMQSVCTSTQQTRCLPCPAGSFTELWNHISKCLRCGVCGHNQVVKTVCARDSDCQCQCVEGYYYKRSYDMCLRHSECLSGHGVLSKGTSDNNTVCQVCPNGTYSSGVSAHDGCKEHKSCNSEGLKLLLKGSTWHDSVCGQCESLKSQDGAEYLKEILPAFFHHHKLSIRKLRQIVNKLQDPKCPIVTSGLNPPALYEHINTWIASATPSRIRQLPEILKDVSKDEASEKLQHKLNRIDTSLNQLCALANEVDGMGNKMS